MLYQEAGTYLLLKHLLLLLTKYTINSIHGLLSGMLVRYLSLRYIDEVKICTSGRKVKFSDKMKRHLIAKYFEHKKDYKINIEGFVSNLFGILRLLKIIGGGNHIACYKYLLALVYKYMYN